MRHAADAVADFLITIVKIDKIGRAARDAAAKDCRCSRFGTGNQFE